jgi:hypothetical protein
VGFNVVVDALELVWEFSLIHRRESTVNSSWFAGLLTLAHPENEPLTDPQITHTKVPQATS